MAERKQGRSIGTALVVVALLATSVGSLGAATMAPSGDEAAPVAALFPLWWDANRSFLATAQAGGMIVRPGAISSLLVTQSAEPGFRRKLYAAGAWLLLDPKAIAACLK